MPPTSTIPASIPPATGKSPPDASIPHGQDLNAFLLGDLPPGVNMATVNDSDALLLNDLMVHDADEHGALSRKGKKGGKFFGRLFGGKNSEAKQPQQPNISSNVSNNHGIPEDIPAASPSPPRDMGAGALPQNSVHASFAAQQSQAPEKEKKRIIPCCICGGRPRKMLVAMDKMFHVDCFRCMSCNELIDPMSVFAVSIDPMGEQKAWHKKCYAEFYGIQCSVCKRSIPANEDGSVSFIKHPFFTSEQMCPSHTDEVGRRRCTGCHRFEPEDGPFTNVNDGDRCVCYSCCRTVVMNNDDIKPLWDEVLRFFEFQLNIPVWEEMREIPIFLVGQAAFNENQLISGTSVHGGSSQIVTRGLCISTQIKSMSFRVSSQRFNDGTARFEACNPSGFMDFDISSLQGNVNAKVKAILCLLGLPRDLTGSVLAHEATHAWIKLHPDFNVRKSLPEQVENGCAKLIAYLFLRDGLEPPRRNRGVGPSEETLREYFKFSIETDENEVFGEGYRKAASVYSTIGIQALLNYVVHFQAFPQF